MSAQIISTRQRLINAAIELFTAQGVSETTTKAVAELAQVNEVTLFRHFGNKHGLLLAVISESGVFQKLGEALQQQALQTSSVSQALKNYASDRLSAIAQVPDLVLSIIGEARHYPQENRQLIEECLTQVNYHLADYLATVMEREHLHSQIPVEKLASLFNSLLLGYAVTALTTFTEFPHKDDFLENLVELFLKILVTDAVYTEHIRDLPANLVHVILERAKKSSLRDYALIYVLFAAGLSSDEVVVLERIHQINDQHQHVLQITQELIRQVPVNQWIMGKRYGSYLRNPLTQWLKSRKDNSTALFVNDAVMPITAIEIQEIWQHLTKDLLTPEGQTPAIEQTQQTWCVEMLTKGMNLEDLSIITGWNLTKLQPYAERAKEKLAVEQAISLDRKP